MVFLGAVILGLPVRGWSAVDPAVWKLLQSRYGLLSCSDRLCNSVLGHARLEDLYETFTLTLNIRALKKNVEILPNFRFSFKTKDQDFLCQELQEYMKSVFLEHGLLPIVPID